MNLPLHADPLALRLPPRAVDGRRRHVDDLPLDDAALADFNTLLASLDPAAPRVDADQLVTLARWLQRQPAADAEAIVGQRLARAATLRRMLADADWSVDAGYAACARMLLDYLQQVDDVIPDDRPVVGQLDDALLVELSWTRFDAAAVDYDDYCRFRATERPRGDAAERVMAWENDCLARAALVLQRRAVRAHRYVEGGGFPERFRVG